MMSVEQSVECELAVETDVLGENLAQRHFVHHKFHMTWPGFETRPLRWEADCHIKSNGRMMVTNELEGVWKESVGTRNHSEYSSLQHAVGRAEATHGRN
jgi:hypothetical protein